MRSSPLFPRGQWIQLAVADRETNGLVGDIGICVSADGRSAEVGFTISPSCQRRGLGTEALREAIALILEHSPVRQIVCVTDARNAPSIRLLDRGPMRRIASAAAVFRGEPCVEHTYAAFREERGPS
jgi:RimJ/RimL family protein N-acetyltransferase